MTLKSEYFLQMQDTIGDMQTFLIKVLEKGGGGMQTFLRKVLEHFGMEQHTRLIWG